MKWSVYEICLRGKGFLAPKYVEYGSLISATDIYCLLVLFYWDLLQIRSYFWKDKGEILVSKKQQLAVLWKEAKQSRTCQSVSQILVSKQSIGWESCTSTSDVYPEYCWSSFIMCKDTIQPTHPKKEKRKNPFFCCKI